MKAKSSSAGKIVSKFISTVSDLVLHSKVQIAETNNVAQKYPMYVGQVGTIVKVPVHPITWFKVKFDDGNTVTFRPSALQSIDKVTGKAKPATSGNTSPRGGKKSKSRRRHSNEHDDYEEYEEEEEEEIVEEDDDIEEAEVALDDSKPKSQKRYATRLANGHVKKKKQQQQNIATASDLQYQSVPLSSIESSNWFNMLVKFQKYQSNENSSNTYSASMIEYQYGNVSGTDSGFVYITSSDNGEEIRKSPNEVFICTNPDEFEASFSSSSTSALSTKGRNTSSSSKDSCTPASRSTSPRGRPPGSKNSANLDSVGGNGHSYHAKRLQTSSCDRIESVESPMNAEEGLPEAPRRFPLLSSQVLNQKAEKIKKCIKEQKKYLGQRPNLETTRRLVRNSFITTDDGLFVDEDSMHFESRTKHDFDSLTTSGGGGTAALGYPEYYPHAEKFLVAVEACEVCKLERWPGSNYCWNKNCSISPIFSPQNHALGLNPFDNDTLLISTATNENQEMLLNAATSFLLLQPSRIEQVLTTASVGGPNNYLSSMLDLEGNVDDESIMYSSGGGGGGDGGYMIGTRNFNNIYPYYSTSDGESSADYSGQYNPLFGDDRDAYSLPMSRFQSSPIDGRMQKVIVPIRGFHDGENGNSRSHRKNQQCEEPSSKGSVRSTTSTYSSGSVPTLLLNLLNSGATTNESGNDSQFMSDKSHGNSQLSNNLMSNDTDENILSSANCLSSILRT